MFDGKPDPYIFFKMHHVWRAEKAWLLSADLGLYEALRCGSATIDDVCKRTGLHRRPVSMLLSANACIGVIGLRNGRHFIHDVMRGFVLEDGDAWPRPRIPREGEDRIYDCWKKALVTNMPIDGCLPPWMVDPEGASGTTAPQPERHGWRIIWGQELAKAFDFSSYHLVADLGGATGGVLVGLTSCYPNLKGVVVDLPYCRRSAEVAIERSGASARVSFWSADFFHDPLPMDVDAYFMSHIIHDWDDERCLVILRRCYEALPPNCPVIVQEFFLNEDKSGSLLAVFQWLWLVIGTAGDQRTADEIADLMAKSGFCDMETRPVDTEQSILIGWKR
jgi:hypothetical protein